MGDYVELADGDRIKIGTAGDNRYMRRDEAEFLVLFDRGGEVRGNLEYQGALWRFPLPNEDNRTLEAIRDCSMFDRLTFTVPRELLPMEHDSICVHIKGKNGACGINRLLPCPLSPEDTVYGSNVPSPIVDIVGERYDAEGRARTIFACGYCDRYFSISEDELEGYRAALVAHFRHWNPQTGEWEGGSWAEQISARIHPNRNG
jgi:hypothetical protein